MGLTVLLTISAMAALGCRPDPLSVLAPEQSSRLAGQASCDAELLPAQLEFVNAIAGVLDTPAETVRLTRLEPWIHGCCNEGQRKRVAEQGGRCADGECWAALAEAQVPRSHDRGREHVGFYVYTRHCKVYLDYYYRYGWNLGKP